MAVAPLLLTCLCATARAEADPACRSEWLPLETGNYWVYQSSSRFVTNSFYTLRVLGPYEIAGQVWCQMESAGRNYFLRVDADDKLLRRDLQSANETVVLDPRGLTPRPLTSPLGFTAPAIDTSLRSLFSFDTSTYASGIGKISSNSSITTGSNGGFSNGDTLIEARIAGKLYRARFAAPQITLDLNPSFANCAIPCYYAACGLGSPVDPPMSVKPCLGARIAGSNIAPNSQLQWTLADSTGATKAERRIPVGDSSLVLFDSLPFYAQDRTGLPITLFPTGDYFVTLWLIDPSGKLSAAATRAVHVN